jgi:hypothetical protein
MSLGQVCKRRKAMTFYGLSFWGGRNARASSSIRSLSKWRNCASSQRSLSWLGLSRSVIAGRSTGSLFAALLRRNQSRLSVAQWTRLWACRPWSLLKKWGLPSSRRTCTCRLRIPSTCLRRTRWQWTRQFKTILTWTACRDRSHTRCQTIHQP